MKSYLVTLRIPILHSSLPLLPLFPGRSLAEDASGTAATGVGAAFGASGTAVAAAAAAITTAALPGCICAHSVTGIGDGAAMKAVKGGEAVGCGGMAGVASMVSKNSVV